LPKKKTAPAILVTPVTTEVVCAGISSTIVEGEGIIGTITSPKCGGESKVLSTAFEPAAGKPATQEHELYTEKPYDLIATTESQTGVPHTSSLESTATVTSETTGKLTCT